MKNTTNKLAWIMWALTTLFFAYQFILRLTPGLVLDKIMQKFDVGSAEYGLFAGFYYLGYAGMQIPVALLLDKYGPKFIIFACAAICAIASTFIAVSDSWHLVLLGRFLIGAGSAAGFLGVAKVLSQWFPQANYARMVGITFSFGLLGAVYGARPVSQLMTDYGWPQTVNSIGIVGVIISVLMFIFLKNKKDDNNEGDEKIWHKLKKICTNKTIVIIGVANLFMVGPLEGFADVWGISYLMNLKGYTQETAATITSTVFIGMIFGGPILAFFAEKFSAYFGVLMLCGIIMALIFGLMIFIPEYLDFSLLLACMFIVGVCCCYQVIIFTVGSLIVHQSYVSIAIALLNSINMLGGLFFHNIIGRVMDSFWQGAYQNGARYYELIAFKYALVVIPLFSLLGAFIFYLMGFKVKLTTMNPKKINQDKSLAGDYIS